MIVYIPHPEDNRIRRVSASRGITALTHFQFVPLFLNIYEIETVSRYAADFKSALVICFRLNWKHARGGTESHGCHDCQMSNFGTNFCSRQGLSFLVDDFPIKLHRHILGFHILLDG